MSEIPVQFRQHADIEERRREQLRRAAQVRTRQRWHARERKRSSMRFYMLSASLVLTAVLVTVGMFATLYVLLA
ncbi:MAG: hypothetical protein ACP5H2_07910 [Solirubrobacteraceae bacterium]